MSDANVSRRGLLRGTGALGAAAGLCALGAAPAVRAEDENEQAPGFYRFRHGDWLVTVLSDGNLLAPPRNFAVNAAPGELEKLLDATAQPRDRAVVQMNVTLVDTGDRRILFDSGSGGRFQERTSGHLLDNLLAANVTPDEIDLVVITHAHPDHCWGLLDEFDDPAFPGAEILIGEKEWRFWMEEAPHAPSESLQGMAAGARRQLLGVEDQLRRIRPGAMIAPGIHVIEAFGHTPGHLNFLLDSGGRSLLLSADSFNHPYVSLAHPEWHLAFDVDKPQASTTRRRILELVAVERMPVIGYHMPWPGLGRVVREGTGYRWIPAPLLWTF